MGRMCSKKTCTLMWALFECMFFAGVVLGWSWLMAIFRTDRYFLDYCNLTNTNITRPDVTETPLVKDKEKTPKKGIRKCSVKNRGKRWLDSDFDLTFDRLKRNQDEMNSSSKISVYYVTTPEEKLHNASVESNFIGCFEQSEQLRILFGLIVIIRDTFVLPIGIFYDKYGTTRTRLLLVLVFAVGTLMMTFTGEAFPWLIVPALSLTGAAGTAVLLTNVQIGNLFGRRRHTVISTYVGASFSSALITFMMQLANTIGVNIQTSFMFLTIGIVPMLVSTIAFLPKTRIPWPLPLDYGKRRNQSLDEGMLRKQRAWQRRMSEAGLQRLRKPQPEFSPLIVQSLFIWSVLWYSVQRLQTAIFEIRLMKMVEQYPEDSIDYERLYGCIQMLAVALSPLSGRLIDRHRRRELGVNPGTQQMQNILSVMCITSSFSMIELITSMVPAKEARILSFLFNIIHRVLLLTSTCAFLMHVHFPQQHFGKLLGLTLALSAIIGAFQFPMKTFLIQKYHSTLQVNVLLLCLSLIVIVHPLNVWNHCRKRLINDQPPRHEERAKRDTGHVYVTAHQDVDDNRIPEGNGEIFELIPELLPQERQVPNRNGDIATHEDLEINTVQENDTDI